MRIATRILIPLSALLLTTGSATAPDDLDTFVLEQMAMRRIPGLSLAIVQAGKIIEARAYGVTDRGSATPVTANTLFQAGSISKSVAALGALHLVEQGKLALDTDVNATLESWKVAASEFNAAKPVTLRGILSHTAGLTVHGFPGYDADSVMPTLVQVLDGTPPTNTAAIRSDIAPGTQWRYSGGGYTVMQQMVIDVTGQTYPDYMQRAVLAPLVMTQSSYEQPPRGALAAATAAGHYLDGRIVHKRWHVYPEMAAAGLWTTPSDLARFAIEVQDAYAGKSSKIISQSMAKQMLTDQKDNDGLGVFLQGSWQKLWFSHNGRDEGFDASLNAAAETGQAVAIMINANDNSGLVPRIQGFIAKKYRWPNATAYVRPAAVSVPEAQVAAVAGRYEVANNQMATLVLLEGHSTAPSTVSPTRSSSHSATTTLRLPTATCGSPSLAMHRAPSLASRVRRERTRGQRLASVRSFPLYSSRTMQTQHSPGIERHGSKVARILYYRMATVDGEQRLMVHLTSDGLVTDVDTADE